ncbi:hypothetical protein WN51_05907 [Melipona quadrifasciata]|uniref:Protein javelin n=1 Tax=Melipona quadrifasciata TaxID=166423 RepID=A0A0M9A8H1_9HYME|nr:hypothetical protein WN51_05907 [Melipona quadrifasciata]
MGGVQSGTHTLGEALWVQERQRQKCHREGGRHEANSAQSTQDRKKLLKRTRSLAVISEDESRHDREARHFRLGQSTFDLPRRHQLIPRAKLIDRNSLKDRPYHSKSACGLHSIPSGLPSFPDPLHYTRGNRTDPDRLNILDWPESPRRYRSVQSLDTVSGLVDIVEDGWPIEGNRSIDCIYTQVKRKRKEHRSLDSILFEDDGELEYFDVLNLLPLSNVRLEFDEEDARNNNLRRRNDPALKSLECLESRVVQERSSARSNATDEEKCKETTAKEESSTQDIEQPDCQRESDSSSRSRDNSPSENATEDSSCQKDDRDSVICVGSEPTDSKSACLNVNEDRYGLDDEVVASDRERVDRKVEEAEDYKSIWISDTEEQEEMSRRPQVLKIVDSDVTKRRHRSLTVDLGSIKRDEPRDEKLQNDGQKSGNCVDAVKSSKKIDEVDGTLKNAEIANLEEVGHEANTSVENARNTCTEPKNSQKDASRGKQTEGRFERIVKETSNIIGKACSVVKGSLGFEARSESSDLGLGSESGSDTRRRSVDDGIDEDHASNCKRLSSLKENESQKTRGNLTRSRSCVDSIECHLDDDQEFDHVRYKIIKSNMFGKNMYASARNDVTYEGLMQYLREYSFQELLLDNNVVIIEPVRAETIERKPSSAGKARSEPSCKVGGAIQKKTETEKGDQRSCGGTNDSGKSPRQSSIKKHFFYHPIRVNRELIDEELPDPDTVKNVRRMFENTLKMKNGSTLSKDCKSVSMKDLSTIDRDHFDEMSEKAEGTRCSSRAKDLTKLFESKEKSRSMIEGKDELDSPRCESKTRILAQSFEARSGHTSPSDSTSSKNKMNRYHHHHHHHHHHSNWDAGSVSSGVSSDYPDTDPGSGVQCISSEDEEIDSSHEADVSRSGSNHYVSPDVLKKIREYGTSVTYYGGKVVNSSNGPLISPVVENRFKCVNGSNDYVKFRLIKSNSCDSRLELTGRLVENHLRHRNKDKALDLSQYTIAETPSIEITVLDKQENEGNKDNKTRSEGENNGSKEPEVKREPPVVIGLEPKKEENKETKSFKADFKLGDLEDAKSDYASRFIGSALTRWQVNENNWRTTDDFGKMEFEEFEVLEDSLNGTESQRLETS